MDVKVVYDFEGTKTYRLEGSIFFGSVLNFKDFFTPNEDPDTVIFDLQNAKVMDHSGVAAINELVEKYESLGKNVILRHVGRYSHNLFEKSKDLTSIKSFRRDD